MTILATLKAELVYFVFFFWTTSITPIFSYSLFFSILACVLIPVIFWSSLKNIFIKNRLYNKLSSAYMRLHNNTEIFYIQLKEQKKK